MMRRALAIGVLLMAAPSGAVGFAASEGAVKPLEVSAGWLRLPPPGVGMMTAAYMTLHNGGREAVTVVGIEATLPVRVELHRTEMAVGRMSMHPVAKIALVPGQTVLLEPGGTHAMVSGLPAMAAGKTLAVTIRLEDGRGVAAELVAKKP